MWIFPCFVICFLCVFNKHATAMPATTDQKENQTVANYQEILQGAVLGFGQRVQFVQVYDGGNPPQLVPVTVQYVIRFPFEKGTANSIEEGETEAVVTSSTPPGTPAAAIRFPSGANGPPLESPSAPGGGFPQQYPSAPLFSLADLVQATGGGSSHGLQGGSNAFQMRPALGGVPVVPPGSYEPFAMFWYLPVNPQIPIDTVKHPGQHRFRPFAFAGGHQGRRWPLRPPQRIKNFGYLPTRFYPQVSGSS